MLRGLLFTLFLIAAPAAAGQRVIRSATQVGAMAMGRGETLGVIAPGRIAHLVVIESDPLADVSNMRSVLFPVKRGRRYDRSDYRPITAEEAGADDD